MDFRPITEDVEEIKRRWAERKAKKAEHEKMYGEGSRLHELGLKPGDAAESLICTAIGHGTTEPVGWCGKCGANLAKSGHYLVGDKEGYAECVSDQKIGSDIVLNIARKGERLEPITIPVSGRKIITRSGQKRVPSLGMEIKSSKNGLQVANLNPQSHAAKAGVRVGDHILNCAGRDVTVKCPEGDMETQNQVWESVKADFIRIFEKNAALLAAPIAQALSREVEGADMDRVSKAIAHGMQTWLVSELGKEAVTDFVTAMIEKETGLPYEQVEDELGGGQGVIDLQQQWLTAAAEDDAEEEEEELYSYEEGEEDEEDETAKWRRDIGMEVGLEDEEEAELYQPGMAEISEAFGILENILPLENFDIVPAVDKVNVVPHDAESEKKLWDMIEEIEEQGLKMVGKPTKATPTSEAHTISFSL